MPGHAMPPPFPQRILPFFSILSFYCMEALDGLYVDNDGTTGKKKTRLPSPPLFTPPLSNKEKRKERERKREKEWINDSSMMLITPIQTHIDTHTHIYTYPQNG